MQDKPAEMNATCGVRVERADSFHLGSGWSANEHGLLLQSWPVLQCMGANINNAVNSFDGNQHDVPRGPRIAADNVSVKRRRSEQDIYENSKVHRTCTNILRNTGSNELTEPEIELRTFAPAMDLVAPESESQSKSCVDVGDILQLGSRLAVRKPADPYNRTILCPSARTGLWTRIDF